MNFTGQKFHFIGVGGAGMAPLAELCAARGVSVSGSDSAPNGKTARLERLGVTVHRGHREEHLPDDATLTIYSSAVPPDNPERRKAARLGIPELRRGEFLAGYASGFRRVAAVSGSHGKTSITALLVRMMEAAGAAPGYLIGASLADRPNCSNGSGDDLFIIEVDESDGTHTLVYPFLGVVPNVEDDHSWSVGGSAALRENFRRFGLNSNRLVYCASPSTDELYGELPGALRVEPLDSFAGLLGIQARNAYLAAAAAELLGCPRPAAEAAAADYPRVERRMRVRFDSPELTVIEDYAHHPTEVAGTLALLRMHYPHHHLRVLFQPHRYARLERFFDGFVRELGTADSVLITPVFAAWSESGRVDGQSLARAIRGGEYVPGPWDDTARRLADHPARPLLLAVLGAGDVERVFDFLPGAENLRENTDER